MGLPDRVAHSMNYAYTHAQHIVRHNVSAWYSALFLARLYGYAYGTFVYCLRLYWGKLVT